MATANPATPAAPPVAAAKSAPKRPSAARRLAGSVAALRDQRAGMIQLILFAAGSVLMPLGILAIGLGWYGSAHAKYDYDQNVYLISGGVMGLGLAIVGGFLYFGAWLARMVTDQRDTQRQLADSLRTIATLLAEQNGPATQYVDDNELVFAGDGSTLHRRGCPLISARTDLRPATGREPGTTNCRVCHPDGLTY